MWKFIKKKANYSGTASPQPIETEYLMDFYNMGVDISFTSGIMGMNATDVSFSTNQQSIEIGIKPIDIFNEIETIPNPFSMQNLEEKISLLEKKIKLIRTDNARDVKDVVQRLKWRKQYKDNEEIRKFFDSFVHTNDAKINLILNKYKLAMKRSDLYIKAFPEDAVEIMILYNKWTEKITQKKAVFYVIADKADFKDEPDPILLAQSPFGYFWQILGAWDKEMKLLSEL